MTKLTVSKINKITEPGMYSDGGCLFLRVAPGGSKSWVVFIGSKGRNTQLGIGGLSYVTLEEARDEARRLRKLAKQGLDPRAEKKKKKLTVDEAIEEVFQIQRKTWKSERHGDIWKASLTNYVSPIIGNKDIDTIVQADILKVFLPIWTEMNATAKRIKQRLEGVFEWARTAGHYKNENPVRGIEKIMPKVKLQTKHMEAMAWAEIPAFLAALDNAVSSELLRFVVMTAVRSTEAREAQWSEIDIAEKVWTIPAERMKMDRPHRVPLTDEMIEVLDRVRGLSKKWVFPSPLDKKKPMAVNVLIRKVEDKGVTVHGFRSSFRDWASEVAHAEHAVAEAALAHVAGNKVVRAYARSDLFDRRIDLMAKWTKFCVTIKEGDNVVQFARP